MDTLKGILGDNAGEKIQNVLGGLQGESAETGLADFSGDELTSQIRNIVGQMSSANDRRSNLLLSLKPYMRSERQKSIDNAIKILNLTKLSGLFK